MRYLIGLLLLLFIVFQCNAQTRKRATVKQTQSKIKRSNQESNSLPVFTEPIKLTAEKLSLFSSDYVGKIVSFEINEFKAIERASDDGKAFSIGFTSKDDKYFPATYSNGKMNFLIGEYIARAIQPSIQSHDSRMLSGLAKLVNRQQLNLYAVVISSIQRNVKVNDAIVFCVGFENDNPDDVNSYVGNCSNIEVKAISAKKIKKAASINENITAKEDIDDSQPLYKGVINGWTRNLVTPVWNTDQLDAVKSVQVEVVVSKNGNVISAKALNGNSSQKEATEKAALASKFSPLIVKGERKKMSGIIIYITNY